MDDGRRIRRVTLAAVNLPPLPSPAKPTLPSRSSPSLPGHSSPALPTRNSHAHPTSYPALPSRNSPVVHSPAHASRALKGVHRPTLPSRPGAAVRQPAPTPPPRPDSTLATPPVRLEGGAIPFSSLSVSNNVRVESPSLGVISPSFSSSSSSSSPLDQTISLTNPRTVRQQNVYVETPIKGLTSHCDLSGKVCSVKTRPRSISNKAKSNHISAVIKQPQTCLQTIEPPPLSSPSIICGECGRCRCDACRSARPLPSTWLCDNGCLCSAETAVDTLSCMCCVKAGLYHCGEGLTRDTDTRDETWVDKPCSCAPTKW